jgi:hypothetical protein
LYTTIFFQLVKKNHSTLSFEKKLAIFSLFLANRLQINVNDTSFRFVSILKRQLCDTSRTNPHHQGRHEFLSLDIFTPLRERYALFLLMMHSSLQRTKMAIESCDMLLSSILELGPASLCFCLTNSNVNLGRIGVGLPYPCHQVWIDFVDCPLL